LTHIETMAEKHRGFVRVLFGSCSALAWVYFGWMGLCPNKGLIKLKWVFYLTYYI